MMKMILRALKICIDSLSKVNKYKENEDAWREKIVVQFTSAGPPPVPDAQAAAGDSVDEAVPPRKKGRPSKTLRCNYCLSKK